MSIEEDYLMEVARKVERRLKRLEDHTGLTKADEKAARDEAKAEEQAQAESEAGGKETDQPAESKTGKKG